MPFAVALGLYIPPMVPTDFVVRPEPAYRGAAATDGHPQWGTLAKVLWQRYSASSFDELNQVTFTIARAVGN
jgi:hypothetical protein